MATKRTNRIDPNAAFAAIVGAGEDAPLAPAQPSADDSVNKKTPATPTAKKADKPAAKKTPSAKTVPAEEIPNPKNTLKLVQKGYYLTEEQTKKLGLFAVLQDTDRSAIVREALDMYFETYKDVLP